MLNPNFLLLYVADPAASAVFYAGLLESQPIQQSPTFAMFALRSGIMLGLWQRDGVEPAAADAVGGGELAFSAADNAAVDAAYTAWRARGLTILQTPVAMDFGYTFAAADPDGHRLRVFAPSEPR